MKTNLFFLTVLGTFITTQIQAQNSNQINAMNSEVSANLDLRAVSSLFGEALNLEDFEMHLNDPKLQLSNLDLNNDNQVDYLRVVESVKNRNHLILIQAVIDRDVYQDVATINVEKNNYNSVNIQIIGNRNLYGANYIYKPVYYRTPILLSLFWNSNYRPYYSNWRWNYYPKYYYSWNSRPYYKYHSSHSYSLNNYHNNSRNYRKNYYTEDTYKKKYNNQRYNYSNSNQPVYESNHRESTHNGDRRYSNEYSPEERNNGSKRYGIENENYRRDNTQNRPLEMKEVEINRNNTQYVSTPSMRENNRNARENFRRN
jgi:hypothetical protein